MPIYTPTSSSLVWMCFPLTFCADNFRTLCERKFQRTTSRNTKIFFFFVLKHSFLSRSYIVRFDGFKLSMYNVFGVLNLYSPNRIQMDECLLYDWYAKSSGFIWTMPSKRFHFSFYQRINNWLRNSTEYTHFTRYKTWTLLWNMHI